MRAVQAQAEWLGPKVGPADPRDAELGHRLVNLARRMVRIGRRELAALLADEPLDLDQLPPLLVCFETRPFSARLVFQDGVGGIVELLPLGGQAPEVVSAVAEFVVAGLSRLEGKGGRQVIRRWTSDRILVLVAPEPGTVGYWAMPGSGRGRRSERLFGLAIGRSEATWRGRDGSLIAPFDGEPACA
jgi:hypothetical protein